MKALNPLQMVKLSSQLIAQIYSLSQRPYWPRERIEDFQLKQIRKILAAAKNVEMYKKRGFPSELRSLRDLVAMPILTKDELLSFNAIEVTNQKFKPEDLIVSKSSGSTGKALDVYYDLESYNFFILAGLRLYFMAFKYMPWHRQTYIYTSPYPLKSLFGFYPLEFISTLNPIPDTIEKLRERPPDLLVCYPSHLRSIASQMKPSDFEVIKPQAINVNSEMSSQAERDYLGKLFNCFVFDDYSSEELTRIASQCRHHSYHLFEDINYIEVVDDQYRPVPEGTVGNIVGTNLHNIGMPLIRYAQGDRGAIRTKSCECGRTFKVLEKLEGRKNDAFTLSTGETISSGFLLDLTYEVFLGYPGAVSAFCLVQDQPDIWTLELVPSEKWSQELETRIPAELEAKLRNNKVKINSKIVKEVRKTKSGKANPIISDLKK